MPTPTHLSPRPAARLSGPMLVRRARSAQIWALRLARRLWRGARARQGATVIEYAVMAALLGIGLMLGTQALREDLSDSWSEGIEPAFREAVTG